MPQGIGRALVADAEAIARTAHVSTIEVTANAHAVPFYERAGFESVGTVGTPLGAAGLADAAAYRRLTS